MILSSVTDSHLIWDIQEKRCLKLKLYLIAGVIVIEGYDIVLVGLLPSS